MCGCLRVSQSGDFKSTNSFVVTMFLSGPIGRGVEDLTGRFYVLSLADALNFYSFFNVLCFFYFVVFLISQWKLGIIFLHFKTLHNKYNIPFVGVIYNLLFPFWFSFFFIHLQRLFFLLGLAFLFFFYICGKQLKIFQGDIDY